MPNDQMSARLHPEKLSRSRSFFAMFHDEGRGLLSS